MKLVKVFIFFLMISIACCSEPAQESFPHQSFKEKMEFFYINPDPLIAKQIIREIADRNALNNFFYFFVALAKEHPKQLMGWFSDAQVSIEQHPKLIHALHFGGLKEEAIRLAQKLNWSADEMFSLRKEAPLFLIMPIDFPGYISCMFSHFAANGDVRYIKRVIDALEVAPALMKDSKKLRELKEEAEQKLASAIFYHDRVYRLCLQEAKTRKGEVAIFLNKLLEELHQANNNSFPHQQTGMFNGFVLITDDPHFEKQWDDLPALSTPVLKQIETIPYPKENKKINVFIMFNGMELDKDLNAYVTYDLEITDPKGNTMGTFDNIFGMKRKTPNRFFLQKAAQSITLELCPDNKEEKEEELKIAFPGTYVIKATLKDHMSGKSLQLSSTLEILPKE